MNNREIAQKALDVYADREHWTYCQGTIGNRADSDRCKNLYNYYRRVGNASTCDYDVWLREYGTADDGTAKFTTDCSNFIQYLLGSSTNASTWHFNSMKAVADMYTAPVGSVLYMTGHVGIVVTQGVKNADGTFKVAPECVDFYKYNHTCRKADYRGALWTKAVYLEGVDYTDTVVLPVSIEAVVGGKHYLGDTLSAKDFTITVKMSDGSVLTNPSNWSAWPLKLVDTVTNITVKYQNVSCIINVDFLAEFNNK